jgi:hypothetical protein
MKLPSREWTGAFTVSVVAVVLAALDILDGSVHRRRAAVARGDR